VYILNSRSYARGRYVDNLSVDLTILSETIYILSLANQPVSATNANRFVRTTAAYQFVVTRGWKPPLLPICSADCRWHQFLVTHGWKPWLSPICSADCRWHQFVMTRSYEASADTTL